MDFSRRLALVSTLLVVPLVVRGQSTVPALTQALPAQTIDVGGAVVNIDLKNYFSLPGITGQVAQFDTVLGKFNVELLANDAPKSVANFLSYVTDASYANTIIHRVSALDGGTGNRIVQGGGYDTNGNSIARKAPIPLEYKLANVRGTLAFARTNDPNSATSEWFFNVDDNITVLGSGNGGGFAVFARVLGTGMSVVDPITTIPRYPLGFEAPGEAAVTPLRDVVAGQTIVALANLIVINSVTTIPIYPTDNTAPAVLAFTVASDNSAAVTATLSGSSLTLTPVSAGTASISVRAADINGNFASSVFNVTITAAAAPTITTQPVSQTISSGSTVVFSVSATGAPTPTYQWRKDNVNISGATGATLVIQGATVASQGNYTVSVANSVNTVVSTPPAALSVTTTSDPGRLINLAILTPLATGEMMTMGTVLGGAGTSGTKPLLARAAGPALAQLGISAFLPDPTMVLNDTTPTPAVVVATNNDWAGASALSTAFASVGAFPYASANSKDAALFQSGASALASGKYTVQVSDTGSGSGTVIAEIYDASGAAYTLATLRLINVSVLKQINVGDTLTAGFVIGGSTARSVLIRAIGPGLTLLGVGGVMPDPRLVLNNVSVNPAVVVATNDNWSGDTAIAQAATNVGAFAVSDGASKDAMLLITLAPGNYTAQVSPVGTGGLVIVEVYEVP